MTDILAFDPERTTNARAMVHACQLGWIQEPVFDATYNTGKFWTEYRPDGLYTNDIAHPADYQFDWTKPIPKTQHERYVTVVFDPDYKMQGTPSTLGDVAKMNESYGTNIAKTTTERLEHMLLGATNLSEMVEPNGHMLIKCMDQIFNGRHGSQTGMFLDLFDELPGWRFVSWLHVSAATTMPQRSQVNPRNNYSTLMCFQRKGGGVMHPTIRKVREETGQS